MSLQFLPIQHQITLRYYFTNSNSNKIVKIYNTIGKQVFLKNVNAKNKLTITTNNLPSGIYFVVVEENNRQSIKKLIISKK